MDRIDESNGCLRYIPGSHRLGVRPHQTTKVLGFSQGISDYNDEDRRREVTVLLEPGDALAHHGNMIHRAEPGNPHVPILPAARVNHGWSGEGVELPGKQDESGLRPLSSRSSRNSTSR